MKKVSIIACGLIFIIAFCVVGFFGADITVYNPTIYVTSIIWDTVALEKQHPDFIINKYDEPDKDNHNAKLTYFPTSIDPTKGIKINIKCLAKPDDATDSKLNYYMDTEGVSAFKYEVLKDNTCDVTFFKDSVTTLKVTTNDMHDVEYSIKFVIVSD